MPGSEVKTAILLSCARSWRLFKLFFNVLFPRFGAEWSHAKLDA
jgi:hypothetical protein